LNRYEGMFIFAADVGADDVDAALEEVTNEIKKLEGEVESATRLGKKSFARPLKKQEAGQYAVVHFRFDGKRLDALRARYKLNEKVLRTQIVRLQEQEEVGEPATKRG